MKQEKLVAADQNADFVATELFTTEAAESEAQAAQDKETPEPEDADEVLERNTLD